ncbi:HNH endonuclease signature motif containing protein [Nocardioides sp. GCM10027113]|uniref:HNH endonuclease signature motif containing protein n=1 Tax=unclassified Nocardioides TaxID=2615069 RepID=UPI00361A1D99
MTATTVSTSPGESPVEVLAFARDRRRAAQVAEAELLVAGVEWAVQHPVESLVEAAGFELDGADTAVPIAGEGCPLITEFCVAEWAASLGMSTDAGRAFLGEAVELRYRLPRLYRRVVHGDLPAWRARHIARHTIALNRAAAEFVDRHVAHVAHKIGLTKVKDLIDEAIARHDPDLAQERFGRAADHRSFEIHLDSATLDGTVDVHGVLDAADALDLEHAVADLASQLRQLGSDESLDVRRSKAVGELARGAQTLDLTSDSGEGESKTDGPRRLHRRPTRRRKITLVIHVSEDAITGTGPLGRVEGMACPITTDQIESWLQAPDVAITVKPVVDPTGCAPVGAYEVPDRLADLVDDRDHHCVFPWCTRKARACDHDHVIPHGERGGPTCRCNLAALCRKHHRLKTHGGWSYTHVDDGVFLWRSPHGHAYLRDETGTRDVTPDPAACRQRLIDAHRPGTPPER